ncbi:MAG: nucleotidyl transferase AbiEii/AbiGii toxin family protein [Candidatus Pacebacteria bacterium]|nr:nucleotidyl transferase AbiEii/AbiGii toxin family protein [Candidatus Paceibacterota bacterium]
MILQELKTIVDNKIQADIPKEAIRNLLKQHLQYYFLNFLYNSDYGRHLIFIGGSALRVCYGLNRLSEDIDMDIEKGATINKKELAEDILKYFKQKFLFNNLEYSISGHYEKIYFKFPILKELGLAADNDSDKLYVKLEISDAISGSYTTELTAISALGFNFIIRNYNLETLMASKICAIFTRKYFKGKDDNYNFKGRDYFDLLWYLQKGIIPNMEFIKDTLKIDNLEELYLKLNDLVQKINIKYLKEDLVPLFEDGAFIEKYCENYKTMAQQFLSKK